MATLVRRRALLYPFVIAAVTLLGWILAGVVWGAVWPLLLGTFMPARAIRQIFGITVIGGGVTTAFVFFASSAPGGSGCPPSFPRAT